MVLSNLWIEVQHPIFHATPKLQGPFFFQFMILQFYNFDLFYTAHTLLILQGTVSFGAGFYFITIGWPIFGVILEAYGFIILFRYAIVLW